MSLVGDTCVDAGDVERFIGDPVSIAPVTIAPFDVARMQRGGSAVITAEGSYSEDLLDTLTFVWEVVSHPNNEYVYHRGSELRLNVDTIGEYEITLLAKGANGGCGVLQSVFVYVFSSNEVHHSATALDTSWVWEMLPSSWSSYNPDLRTKAELYWRGLTQLIGADTVKAFALDANKGVLNANDMRPSRWLPVATELDASDVTVVLRELSSVDLGAITSMTRAELPQLFTPASFRSDNIPLVVRSSSEFAVSTSEHEVMDFDRGATLEITLGADTLIVNIVAVDYESSSFSVYTVEPPLPNVVEGDTLIGSFVGVPEDRSRLIGAVGDRGVAFTEIINQGQVNAVDIVSGYLLDTDTSLTQTPYISRVGLWDDGVRPGDTLRVSVTNRDTNASVDLAFKIIDVLTLPDGVDYAPIATYAGSFQDALVGAMAAIASDVEGVAVESLRYIDRVILPRASGVPINNSFSANIHTLNRSVSFNVAARSISLRSSLKTDRHVRELTTLREFIELQNVDSTGTFVLTEGRRAIHLGREPITLLENRDFYVFSGGLEVPGLSFNVGDAYITAAQGDMSYTVRVGDLLQIREGFGVGDYRVVKVLKNRLYVDNLPRLGFSSAVGHVHSRDSRTLVNLTEEARLPVVNRLSGMWCESATVLDYKEIEARYGVIAGLSHNEWAKLNTEVSYMSLLRALHIASVSSTAILGLRNLASMVLGLPYTSERVLVKRVDLAAKTVGLITYDKVTVEVVDQEGFRSGMLDSFYAVSDTQANLQRNFGFIDAVREGEILEPATVLSKGVSIRDDVDASPLGRHVFDIKIAAGVSDLNTNMVSFLRQKVDELKPSYTDFRIIPEIHVVDEIHIESDIEVRLKKRLTDTPYGLHGPAEVLDDFIPGMGRLDTTPFHVLNTWFPSDGQLNMLDANSQARLVSETGGFVTPLNTIVRTMKVLQGSQLVDMDVTFKGRFDEGVWIKPGDAVIFPSRHEIPPLEIQSITDDNEVVINTQGLSLATESNAHFLVIRYVEDILMTIDHAPAVIDESSAIIDLGARASNVGRGDLISFKNPVDSERPIRFFRGNLAVLESRGFPPLSGLATGGDVNIRVRRGSIELFNRPDINVTPEIEPINQRSTPYPPAVSILRLGSNCDYLGVKVGDYVDSCLVVGTFQDRRLIAVVSGDSPLEAPSPVSHIRPQGLLGHDALDLAEGGVRSSVHIKIRQANHQAFHLLDVNDDGDVTNTNGVLDDVLAVQGDQITFNLQSSTYIDEGLGVFRVLTGAEAQGGQFSTNAPAGVLDSNTPYIVELVRQSPIRAYNHRER